jgi:hypothetical protein
VQREVEIKKNVNAYVLMLRWRYAEDSPWYQTTLRYNSVTRATSVAREFMMSTDESAFEIQAGLVIELNQE